MRADHLDKLDFDGYLRQFNTLALEIVIPKFNDGSSSASKVKAIDRVG